MKGKRGKSRDGSATSADIRRCFGEISEEEMVQILDLQPSLRELEEAGLWASGEGEALGKAGEPVQGVVARILEIVSSDVDKMPDDR